MRREQEIGQYSVTVTSSADTSLKSPGLPVWQQGARRGWRPGACVGLQVFCASLGLTQPAATARSSSRGRRHPPPAIRRPPAAASPRAMVGPQSSGGLSSLRTPLVTFTILSLARSSINLRILRPVLGH